MALESQGVQLRRASSSLATAASSVLTYSTSQVLSSDTAEVDFVTNGFATGMQLTGNSSASTSVYTINTVAASALTLAQTATADASTTISITGYTMNPVAELVSINGPSQANSEIDITNLGSTAKEFLPGLLDNGQVTIEGLLNFDATGQQTNMRDDQQARTKGFYDIVYTDAGTSAGDRASFDWFESYVVAYTPSAAVDDALKVSMTLKVSSGVKFVQKT